MLTKKQLEILEVFYRNIFSEYTFKQIKADSGQKSNNIVQLAIKEFLKQELIISKRIGNIITYLLNLDNNLTLSYLNLINEIKTNKMVFPKSILAEIQRKIKKETPFFVLIVFGSYAKKTAKANSDLDIAVIIDSVSTKKNIIPLLETVKRREIIKIDYHPSTVQEFQEMLKSDYENLGKQIFKNSLIYHGYGEYISIIKGIIK